MMNTGVFNQFNYCIFRLPSLWDLGPPLTDGAAADTWRGETDALGLHGGDLTVALAPMLLQSVPMG